MTEDACTPKPEQIVKEKLPFWLIARFYLNRLAGRSIPWSLTNEDIQRMVRRHRGMSLEKDRAKEVADFFELSLSEVLEYPAVRDKSALHAFFCDIATDSKLLENYRSARTAYVARLMVKYNRLSKALALARVVARMRASVGLVPSGTVIDYGCGAADFALVFFLLGWNAVIVDISGGNLEFAEFRFRSRNWPVISIGVSDTDPYPDLPESSLVVAGEVLEHVRNPVETCRYLVEHLSPGGFLWVSGFPFVDKELKGDHLPEALALAGAVREWLEEHLELCSGAVRGVRHFTGRLFRKV